MASSPTGDNLLNVDGRLSGVPPLAPRVPGDLLPLVAAGERRYPWGMSSADAANEWDLIVPSDDAELAAEFRRHGVKPGQRLHVAVVDRNGTDTTSEQELPSFFASFNGPADLAERSGEILRSEFPGA